MCSLPGHKQFQKTSQHSIQNNNCVHFMNRDQNLVHDIETVAELLRDQLVEINGRLAMDRLLEGAKI